MGRDASLRSSYDEDMDLSSSSNESQPREKPGLLSGKFVLLASALILIVIVPTATWLTLRAVEQDVKRQPLNWDERTSWQLLPVRFSTLDKSGFLQPPGDAPLRDTDFRLEPEPQSKVMAAVALLQDGAGEPGAIRQMAERLADTPGGFYVNYAAASLATDSAERERLLKTSFALSPAALVLRFVDQQGQAKANWPVGTLTLMHAQIEDSKLDNSLRLLYPDQVTDELGRVYLPMFATPVKLIDKPEHEGLDIKWPIEDYWMTWPGVVGSPRPIVVQPDSGTPSDGS